MKMNCDEENIRKALSQYDQEHLLGFWNDLNDEEKQFLLTDIKSINLRESIEFYERISPENVNNEKLDSRMEPVPVELHGSITQTKDSLLEEYECVGLKQISDGHVGVLLLAGGQGTRLGVSDPKGMFDVGLPSRKSLFQIQAERILKLQSLAEDKYCKPCSIPWYIMTSPATTEKTKHFFEKHHYFGLNAWNVVMFEQGMLPCFDFDGKIILESKFKIAKSPDGNGGLYKALKDNHILEDMEKRNVKYLHAYCVDNILVKVADPIFIGYCVNKKAECGAKVVNKVSPDEPIGVFCIVDKKLQVVEYSEITKQTAEKTNSNGSLTFNAGNICNHFFTLDFLKTFINQHENQMKLHRAEKKITHVDAEGNAVKPSKINGVKIEKFVFDVFPFADNFVMWEVNRDEEFSPLKNSLEAKKDNSETARKAMFELHKKYIKNAGGRLVFDGPFEISPLVTYAGEGLTDYKGKDITVNHLKAPNEKSIVSQNGYH